MQRTISYRRRHSMAEVLPGFVRGKLYVRNLSSTKAEDEDDEDSLGERMGVNGFDLFTPRYRLCKRDLDFIEEMCHTEQMFVITDPAFPDNPIVYASRAFCRFTGYRSSDIVGVNCRFLQGNETDGKNVKTIRRATKTGLDATLGILNYKKNGEIFYNQFFMTTLRSPVPGNVPFGRRGKIRYFIGVQSSTWAATYDSNEPENRVNYGRDFREKQKKLEKREFNPFVKGPSRSMY